MKTVKELVEELQRLDPALPVAVEVGCGALGTYAEVDPKVRTAQDSLGRTFAVVYPEMGEAEMVRLSHELPTVK